MRASARTATAIGLRAPARVVHIADLIATRPAAPVCVSCGSRLVASAGRHSRIKFVVTVQGQGSNFNKRHVYNGNKPFIIHLYIFYKFIATWAARSMFRVVVAGRCALACVGAMQLSPFLRHYCVSLIASAIFSRRCRMISERGKTWISRQHLRQ